MTSRPARDHPWRVGRKLGRTLYAQLGPDPGEGDLLLGMLDDAELAAYIVELHNASLRQRGGPAPGG